MKQIYSALIVGALAVSVTPAIAAPLPQANVVLSSAKSVDLAANTVTLPLHKGSAKGATGVVHPYRHLRRRGSREVGPAVLTPDRFCRPGHRAGERNDLGSQLPRNGRLLAGARFKDRHDWKSDRSETR